MKRLFDGAGNVGEEVSVDADAPVPVRVQRAAARWRVVQLKGVESAGNGEGLDLVNGGGQDARRAFGLQGRRGEAEVEVLTHDSAHVEQEGEREVGVDGALVELVKHDR